MAYIIFRGTVVAIEDLSESKPDPNVSTVPLPHRDSGEPRLVTFKVDRGWKGPVEGSLELFVFQSPSLGSAYHFRRGQAYVVYAVDDVPRKWNQIRRVSKGLPVYGIGACTLRIRQDFEEESRRLGRGFAPL